MTSQKIQRILFPVDFSESCRRASVVVRQWAERFEAHVTLLHVCETAGLFAGGEPSDYAQIEQLRICSAERLSHFLIEELGDVPVTRVSLEGKSGSRIVEYAASNDIDLIMMPTLGTTRFRQLLLGSVTSSVLHDSELPVWTFAHIPEPKHFAIPASIVCAIDCGPESLKVIRWGQALAARFGANLTVVHSRPAIDPRFESGIADRAHEFVVRTAREDYDQLTRGLDNIPPLEIVEGANLVAGVQSILTRENAELLVIGRGKFQGFLGRLRTNAHDLIRLAGCPVLSI